MKKISTFNNIPQDEHRNLLSHELTKICIELYLVAFLKCKIDESIASRSKQVATKHSNISRNIKTCEIDGISNIENPITPGSELSLQKLIIGMKSKDGERFAVNIIRNWKNFLEL